MFSLIVASAVASVALGAPTARDFSAVCNSQPLLENHGCDTFCGFEPVLAGSDWLCMPTGQPSFPADMQLDTDDQEEYCQLVSMNQGCSDLCGYKWSDASGRCETMMTAPKKSLSMVESRAGPIIGGSGKFRYQYMPDKMVPPPGANMVNCHGLVTDKDNNIYLTYQNDGKTDQNCLIRWKPDGTGAEFMTGDGNTTALCSGTPHGLKVKTEGGVEYLYHANNNQKLSKTTLNGTIVWQVNGYFSPTQDKTYRPTWFADPPNSDYMYLCDGYGSNNVYAFSKDGKYMNKYWGGRSPTKGPDAPHGTFSTNHGCTYDPRINDTIIVSDRANSRFEFFNYDPMGYEKFEWYHTVNLQPAMGKGTLPCNIRMYPEQDGRAIVPDLAGPVAVMDNQNEVISVVNVSVLLQALDHKHPHDAIFLPNGDMVVATWAPGRISYWKLLPTEDEE